VQPVVHCGVVRQAAEMIAINGRESLKTGERARVRCVELNKDSGRFSPRCLFKLTGSDSCISVSWYCLEPLSCFVKEELKAWGKSPKSTLLRPRDQVRLFQHEVQKTKPHKLRHSAK
jgi:hypothetical protein